MIIIIAISLSEVNHQKILWGRCCVSALRNDSLFSGGEFGVCGDNAVSLAKSLTKQHPRASFGGPASRKRREALKLDRSLVNSRTSCLKHAGMTSGGCCCSENKYRAPRLGCWTVTNILISKRQKPPYPISCLSCSISCCSCSYSAILRLRKRAVTFDFSSRPCGVRM